MYQIPIAHKVNENVTKTFDEKILAGVEEACGALKSSANVYNYVGGRARELAVRMFNLLDHINTTLFQHFFVDGDRCRSVDILHVARLPGEMFLVQFADKSMSAERFRALGKLLQERSASVLDGGGLSEGHLSKSFGPAAGETASRRLSDNVKK